MNRQELAQNPSLRTHVQQGRSASKNRATYEVRTTRQRRDVNPR
jgi:hypothetical protein